MSPSDVVREYLEAAFVRHDLGAIEPLVSSEALVAAARSFVTGFPDIEMRFEHTAAEDDWVAVGVSASVRTSVPFRDTHRLASAGRLAPPPGIR